MLLIPSLRARILLLLLAVVLPMLCVVSYSFYEQRQNMVRTLEQEMTTDARILAGVMAQKVDGARGLLSALAYSPSIYNRDSVGCDELLAHIFNENSQYTNLGVADPDGNVFCSALPMTKPVNVLDRTWFQRTVKNPDIAFGNYQIGRIVGKPVMIMAHAARSESGEVQAAIFVPFDLDQLAKIPEQIKRPWNIEFLIFDRNGTILAHDPDQDKWVGKTAGESSLIKTILTRHAGLMETKGIDGITRLYSFIPVAGTDNSIFVSIGVSRDVYLADTNRIFIRNLMILSVIVVLSFVVAMLISRLSAQAEEKLIAGAEQFRDLYDNAPNGYLSFGTDGLIKRCNKRMSELLGSETERLLGLHVVNLYADVPDGKEKANKLFQRFLSGETIFEEEIQLRKSDGMAVWMSLSMNAVLDAQGQVLEGRAIIQDITERRRNETRAQQLGQLLKSSFNEIYLFDAHTLHFLQTSDGAQKNLGYSADELAQLTPLDLKPVC
jgi:PAS domain S-box-containing protein